MTILYVGFEDKKKDKEKTNILRYLGANGKFKKLLLCK